MTMTIANLYDFNSFWDLADFEKVLEEIGQLQKLKELVNKTDLTIKEFQIQLKKDNLTFYYEPTFEIIYSEAR